MRRINILGAPGYGKTTLALGIAHALMKQGRSIEYINEVAKHEWVYEGRKPDPYDQLIIGSMQAHWERRALRHNDIVVTDSPIILASVYAEVYGATNNIITETLVKNAKLAEQEFPSLNLFLIKPCFEYQNRGRFHNEKESEKIQETILKYALDFQPFHVVQPSQTFEAIMEFIGGFI